MPDYNAAITSQLFWVQEARTTAKLLNEGKTNQEVLELSLNENIYMAPSFDRKRTICNVTIRRMSALTPDLIELMANTDISTARLINLLSILLTNDLFKDFMVEVFKSKKILGEKTVTINDVRKYLEAKAAVYEDVNNISEPSQKKICSTYIKMLAEAGLVENTKTGTIVQPYIDYQLQSLLELHGYRDYMFIITGE